MDSDIASVNKSIKWKIDAVRDCLLHETKFWRALKRTQPILELVSEVKFDISTLSDCATSCHKHYENVGEIINELP